MRQKAFPSRKTCNGIMGTLIFLIILFGAIAAPGQNYSFRVPELKFQVFLQPDSTVKLVYDITFENNKGAHAIDVVDIGMPHKKYDISNMSASIDGKPLKDIRPSEYVKPGVEVHLGHYAIPPGGRGVFHFESEMPRLIFQDTTREDYASLQITPTWFGKQFVTGSGDIMIGVHMLPGVDAADVLYHKFSPFTEKVVYEERTVAIWQYRGAATKPYKVGVSFPKKGLDRVVRLTIFERWGELIRYETNTRLFLGAIFGFLFGWVFFRFTGNTGCSVFVLMLAGLIFLFYKSPTAQVVALPILVLTFIAVELGRRQIGRGHYMPPVARVEAGKVKRGLSAAEAAILLERPLGKVLSLVICGLLKKNVIEQTNPSPLTVRVREDFLPSEGFQHLRKRARDNGIVLKRYEFGFLQVIEKKPGVPVSKLDFTEPMRHLVDHVVFRMKGFDPKATRNYYSGVIDRVQGQALSVQQPDKRWKEIDRNLEWILCDEDYEKSFNAKGYYYQPPWYRDQVQALVEEGKPEQEDKKEREERRTAWHYHRWPHIYFNDFRDTVSPRSLGLKDSGGKVLDLTAFDNITADVFEGLAKGGGGGGGGCACAGCACACACAGGGR